MSSIQVLMHQGELQHIATIIREVGDGRPAGGCLFGLWRNSLKQPVVQFVTGLGKGITYQNAFTDVNYDDNCKEFMEDKHRLLKLGYWYSGSVEDYPNVLASLGKQNCNLFLFIKYNGRSLSGKFFMKKDDEESEGLLNKEDILPGDSSFRLYRPLTDAINEGAKYKFGPDNRVNLTTLVDQMPSRTEVRDPETKAEQWYAGDEGVNLLQAMFQTLQSVPFDVEMSRDANTHNFQFNLNRDYCLDFPPNFPNSGPVLTDRRGNKQYRLQLQTHSQEAICQSLVGVLRPIFSQQRGRTTPRH